MGPVACSAYASAGPLYGRFPGLWIHPKREQEMQSEISILLFLLDLTHQLLFKEMLSPVDDFSRRRVGNVQENQSRGGREKDRDTFC